MDYHKFDSVINMKIYYIYYNNHYYNKLHGWVSHRKFADKLSMSEAQSLQKNFYKGAKILT